MGVLKVTDLIGWLSNMCFATAAIPQALKSIKQGHARGVSAGLLWLSFIGEIFAIIFHVLKDLPLPLLINYCVNMLSLTIILYYRYFGRYKTKE